uniref:Uncharacterized protein n=1 Tax=Octopus bimaculoides TaxID=37653 RepID=A0A0L8G7S4_OCTBM
MVVSCFNLLVYLRVKLTCERPQQWDLVCDKSGLSFTGKILLPGLPHNFINQFWLPRSRIEPTTS